MPRTPREKLATFNIDPEKWERFKALCEQRNSSASAEILKFVESALASSQLPPAEATSLDYLHARLEAIEARLAALEGTPETPASRKPKRKPGTLSLPSFPVYSTHSESPTDDFFAS